MQPMFNIQYAEFKAAEFITKKIKGSSAYIPMSPQEKGIDFLIRKFDTEKSENKICTFQVKMSRSYSDTKFTHSLWFNTYNVCENADWYILVGIYPENLKSNDSDFSVIKWREIMLAFTKEEMKTFLKNIRQKKNPEKFDTKFGFGFNDSKKIFLTRGAVVDSDYSKYLINNRISEIERCLIEK